MASKSSTAALFLATALLLAAAATLAQAQVLAPPPSSTCPIALNQLFNGTLPPINIPLLLSELQTTSSLTILRCACNATQGATQFIRIILGLLGVTLPIGITCD